MYIVRKKIEPSERLKKSFAALREKGYVVEDDVRCLTNECPEVQAAFDVLQKHGFLIIKESEVLKYAGNVNDCTGS